MVSSIIRIRWKVSEEYALQMAKYKKDSLSTEAKMDLDEPFILKEATILDSFVMIRNTGRGSKFRILAEYMREHGKMISLFSSDDI